MKKIKFKNTIGESLINFWIYYTGWGRATRAEFWWSALFYIGIIPALLSFSRYVLIGYFFVIFLPWNHLIVRRLHDTNRSAWYLFISYVLFFLAVLIFPLGFPMIIVSVIPWYAWNICIIVFMCLSGHKKVNKYGPARI